MIDALSILGPLAFIGLILIITIEFANYVPGACQ